MMMWKMWVNGRTGIAVGVLGKLWMIVCLLLLRVVWVLEGMGMMLLMLLTKHLLVMMMLLLGRRFRLLLLLVRRGNAHLHIPRLHIHIPLLLLLVPLQFHFRHAQVHAQLLLLLKTQLLRIAELAGMMGAS
jgi:hypothetical protein